MNARKKHHKKRHNKEVKHKQNSSIKNENTRFDKVIADIDSQVTCFKDRLQKNRSLIANQIEDFYSPSFIITAENQGEVIDCIKLFCAYFPNEAGIILHRNIQNMKKSNVSISLLKAGANERMVSTDKKDKGTYSSFELALFNNAPLELLNLFQDKDSCKVELIEELYREKFVMRDELKPFIQSIIINFCHRKPYRTGLILNKYIDIASKKELSQWLIEAGADLSSRYISRQSTFYYALTSHFPLAIYKRFIETGSLSMGGNDHWYNPLLIALLHGNETAFHFLKHYYSTVLVVTAAALKKYRFAGYTFEGQRELTHQDVIQAKEILWMILPSKDRINYLDREIMEIAFSHLSKVEFCLAKYELFKNHIPIKTSWFLGKCQRSYAHNASDLLDVAGAKICELLRMNYPDVQERLAACDIVMAHPIYTLKHENDWQSEVVKIRDSAKLRLAPDDEKNNTQSQLRSLLGKRR